jgi:hypothetical protein
MGLMVRFCDVGDEGSGDVATVETSWKILIMVVISVYVDFELVPPKVVSHLPDCTVA